MKRFISLLLCASLALACLPARAETILWEDENGRVILGDDGDIDFVPPDTPTPEPPLVVEETFTPAPPEASPTSAPPAAPEKTLQYGDSGEAVLAAQERLTDLGYYHGKCSGDFLEGTQSAARRFQQYNGLSQTGKLDAKTWTALFSAAIFVLAALTAFSTSVKYLLSSSS